MFVLAFFNEEKERIQIEKLTQLSKKCKEKVQKKKKEKRRKKRFALLLFSKRYLKMTIWIILINPPKNIFLNFENKLLNRKTKKEKEEKAGFNSFLAVFVFNLERE